MPDFEPAEYQQRCLNAQRAMHARQCDVMLLCTEVEIRYYTGFRTSFWLSPTRPWFVLLPLEGLPIAIVPEIGASLMQQCYIGELLTWPSPRPQDEGISLLLHKLQGYRRIGLPMGAGSSLRMPLADLQQLQHGLTSAEFVDCNDLIVEQRLVKSEAEIALIASICEAASAAFAQAPKLFSAGQTMQDAFRSFRVALLENGAEEVPYLVGGAGAMGYAGVIAPPDETKLQAGDVLMLDTGASLRGYFCDFDRNFAIERASDACARAYAKLWRATEAALQAAHPGISAEQLYGVMHSSLGFSGNDINIGRMGHGLGMQLTEEPSLMPGDPTVLRPGMVITLEPSIEIAPGCIMVQEENILITEHQPRLLSHRTPPELPVLGG